MYIVHVPGTCRNSQARRTDEIDSYNASFCDVKVVSVFKGQARPYVRTPLAKLKRPKGHRQRRGSSSSRPATTHLVLPIAPYPNRVRDCPLCFSVIIREHTYSSQEHLHVWSFKRAFCIKIQKSHAQSPLHHKIIFAQASSVAKQSGTNQTSIQVNKWRKPSHHRHIPRRRRLWPSWPSFGMSCLWVGRPPRLGSSASSPPGQSHRRRAQPRRPVPA